MLIDVTISGDTNVIKREAARIPKYKYLKTDIPCMWSVKKKVINNDTGKWNHLKSFRK